MNMLGDLLPFVLNFGISCFNAYSVGRSWADSRAGGGWPRFMVWCSAIMSACGFTSCYIIIVTFVAGRLGYMPPHYLHLAKQIGYAVTILPVIGSGLAIWMDSVTSAWRERDIASIGSAAWNTYAEIHNIYGAAGALPDVISNISSAFGESDSEDEDDDSKGKLLMYAVAIVCFALFAGILTTVAIVRLTARNYAENLLPAGT